MAKLNQSATDQALFKNAGIIALGQISTKLLHFFLLPLYTALLTTEQYGLIDLLSTCAGLIAIMVGLQMSQAAFRFLVPIREDQERSARIISTILVSAGMMAAVYALAFFLVSRLIRVAYKWYLLFHVIASLYYQTMACIARGRGKNGVYAAGGLISASLTMCLNVITVAVLRLGVAAMLLGNIIGLLVGGAYIMLSCDVLHYFSIGEANRQDFRAMIRYSLPLIPNELSWSVIHASDRMVISAFLGIAVNGLVAVAARFSAIYTTVFSAFNASWTEQVLFHYKDEGGPEYICKMFDRMVTFFGCVAIGIVACVPFVFRAFVNAQFAEAYDLIPFYMIAVFFNAVIGLISAIYLIEKETGRVAASTMAAAALNVLSDIALVSVIGAFAAPLSSICGYAVISVWRLVDVNKRHCRVVLPIWKAVVLISLLTVTMFGYFRGTAILQFITLLAVAGVSFWLNRCLLRDVLGAVLSRRQG